MWRVSIHAPKDSLLDESFFAAKVVFYCWPYAPSLIHFVSASAARRWRVERGEYSGTGPAIPPPLYEVRELLLRRVADRKRQNERTNPVVINFDASTL